MKTNVTFYSKPFISIVVDGSFELAHNDKKCLRNLPPDQTSPSTINHQHYWQKFQRLFDFPHESKKVIHTVIQLRILQNDLCTWKFDLHSSIECVFFTHTSRHCHLQRHKIFHCVAHTLLKKPLSNLLSKFSLNVLLIIRKEISRGRNTKMTISLPISNGLGEVNKKDTEKCFCRSFLVTLFEMKNYCVSSIADGRCKKNRQKSQKRTKLRLLIG